MPITIPPFVQYQSPIVPLRGLWNKPPAEGDMMVTAEIDWLTTTGNLTAVQFAFAGNSPVPLSQIVALSVDNRNNGYDVDFIFPDSSSTLTVPAYSQGVFPVFTNALMFYVVAAAGIVPGNRTVFQVFNSMPPPVTFAPTAMQTQDAVTAVLTTPGATAQIIPATISGTLNGFVVTLAAPAVGTVTLELVDGLSEVLWTDTFAMTGGTSIVVPVTGMHIRFVNGLSLVVSASSDPTAQASVNVFYTTP